MATKTTTENSFKSILKRSNKEIQSARAERIAEDAKDAHAALLINLRRKKREAEGKLDGMLDISASNNANSLNVLSTNWNPAEFVETIQKLKMEIKMADIQIQVAEETQSDLFPED